MNLEPLLHLIPISALGYALLHSLGQAALLFAILQFALCWARTPVQRYRLFYMAMLGLTTLFLFTFFRQWYLLQQLQGDKWIRGIVLPTDEALISNGYRINQFRTVLPYAGVGYTLGLILLILRMTLGWQKLASLKRNLVAATDEWKVRFASLKTRMGLGPGIMLSFSESARTPMMVGWLRPLVILPVALVSHLDTAQVETILVHELTHVKRKDYSWNLLQILMETLLFFNPIAWWLSAAIRRERELACDDQAMVYISEPLQYAEALLALEVQRTTPVSALAATGNGKEKLLFNRIKRITGMKTTHKSGPQGWIATAMLVAIMAATGSFYQAEAQHKREAATTKNTDSHPSPAPVIKKDNPKKKQQQAKRNQETSVPPPEVAAALNQAREALDDMDMEHIAKTASESIDKEALKKALEEARTQIKQVDWQEINQSVRQAGEAVKAIDWSEISNQINEGLKSVEGLESVDMDQVMEEVRQALQEAKEDLSHSEAEQRQKIREQSRQTRAMLEQSREKVNQQKRLHEEQLLEKMAVVRREQKAAAAARRDVIINYKDTMRSKLLKQRALTFESGKTLPSIDRLLSDLRANKLINDPGNVNVRLTDKALYIDGKKQPDAAFNRVKKYLDKARSPRMLIKQSYKTN